MYKKILEVCGTHLTIEDQINQLLRKFGTHNCPTAKFFVDTDAANEYLEGHNVDTKPLRFIYQGGISYIVILKAQPTLYEYNVLVDGNTIHFTVDIKYNAALEPDFDFQA